MGWVTRESVLGSGRKCSLSFPDYSAVGIAIGYWLGDREVEVRVPVGSRIFASSYRSDRLWGPPNLLYNGTGSSFPRVKRPGREADHSPPTSADVKKM
jgi:hypothetical protein